MATSRVVRQQKKIRLLKQALRAFTEGYPEDEGEGGPSWTRMLHEEGCIGVMFAPNEREEGDECRCDGDELVALVRRALR